jgi:hypothetical protein
MIFSDFAVVASKSDRNLAADLSSVESRDSGILSNVRGSGMNKKRPLGVSDRFS